MIISICHCSKNFELTEIKGRYCKHTVLFFWILRSSGKLIEKLKFQQEHSWDDYSLVWNISNLNPNSRKPFCVSVYSTVLWWLDSSSKHPTLLKESSMRNPSLLLFVQDEYRSAKIFGAVWFHAREAEEAESECVMVNHIEETGSLSSAAALNFLPSSVHCPTGWIYTYRVRTNTTLRNARSQ